MRSPTTQRLVRTALAFAFATSMALAPASAQCSTVDVRQTLPLFGHRFGSAIDNFGERFVVGSPGHFGQGQAQVFVAASDGGVSSEGLLWPSDLQAQDGFGSSVAMHGDYAVVGSPGDDDGAFGAGSAYVFQRFFGYWIQTAKLGSKHPGANAGFGTSVATNGDWIAVGAPLDSTSAPLEGSVEFFERIGSSWVFRLRISGSVAFGRFGASMSLDDDLFAVGQPGESEGRVRVFERLASSWIEFPTLSPVGATLGAEFGCDVALDDDMLIVGARSDSTYAANAGAAYLYQLDGGAWTQKQRFDSKSPAEQDRFGTSVDLEAKTAIVGAPGEETLVPNAGCVHVFSESGIVLATGEISWVEESEFGALSPELGAGFGLAVALRGDEVWVGSPDEDTLEPDAGEVHAFSLDGIDCTPLMVGPVEVSASNPEILHFQINPGSKFANSPYLLLGTTGGASPGVLVGGKVMPLNLPNAYGDLTLSHASSGAYVNTLALLDNVGSSKASIDLSAILTPLAIGQVLHHAYFVFEGGTAIFMSEAIATQVVY
jgi:hypothetical protein